MTPNFNRIFNQYIIEADSSRRQFLSRLGKGAAIGAGLVGGYLTLNPNKKTTTRTEPELAEPVSVAPGNIDTFFEYLKNQENAQEVGKVKNTGRWFPHASYEGGLRTLGYGHKFANKTEQNDWYRTYPKGMTQRQINGLLISDIRKHTNIAKNVVQLQYLQGVNSWYRLTRDRQEMLIDMSFTPGLTKFPKFVTAVLNNDWHTAKKEYKRYSSGRELTRRNRAFFDRFLKDKPNLRDSI